MTMLVAFAALCVVCRQKQVKQIAIARHESDYISSTTIRTGLVEGLMKSGAPSLAVALLLFPTRQILKRMARYVNGHSSAVRHKSGVAPTRDLLVDKQLYST